MTQRKTPLSIAQRVIFYPTLILSKKCRRENDITVFFKVRHNADIEALEKAFNHLVKTQNAFRLRLVLAPKLFAQYTADYQYEKLPVIDVASEDELPAIMEQYRHIEGGLLDRQLYKATIFRCGDCAVLLIAVHHLCFDGYSIGLTAGFLQEYYECFVSGNAPQEKERKYTIEDYNEETAAFLHTKKHKAEIAAYRKDLYSRPDFRILVRPLHGNSPVNLRVASIEGSEYASAYEYCSQRNVPLTFFITAIAALALSEYSEKTDFSFYHLTHDRAKLPRRDMIGCMINTFVSFYHVSGEQTISEFITESYREYLDCFKRGHLTVFEMLFASLRKELSLMRFNNYGLIFTGLNIDNEDFDHDKYDYGVLPYVRQPNQFYCSLSDNHKDRISVQLSYQALVTKEDHMDEIVRYYNDYLSETLSNPNRTIEEINVSLKMKNKLLG